MLQRLGTPLHHGYKGNTTTQGAQVATKAPSCYPAASAAPVQASMLEERRKRISDSIRQVPDFPKKGILFHDVTTLLLDPQVSA